MSLVAFGMLFRMSFNTDVSSFLLEGNETGEAFAALQEKYETTDPINVIATLPDGETFTTSANVAFIAQLRDTLSEIDYEGFMVVEAFGLALPNLAAATKIWRRMYSSEEALARDGLAFMKAEYAKRWN